jgi:hypothetical protein
MYSELVVDGRKRWIQDLRGERFGRLVVTEFAGKYKSGGYQWFCTCDCTKQKIVGAANLKNGSTTSCGCLRQPDITGKKFGKLTAVEKTKALKRGNPIWRCVCDCTRETLVSQNHLIHGGVVSCGCIRVKRREGDVVGMLTVLEEAGRDEKGRVLWRCQCECTKIVLVTTGTLSAPGGSSCGCARHDGFLAAAKEYHTQVLREGTSLDTLSNKLHKNNKTGIRGVKYRAKQKRWIASIRLAGKEYHLGTFKTLEEAAEARREAEVQLFNPVLEKYGREPISEESYQEMLATALEKQKAVKLAE